MNHKGYSEFKDIDNNNILIHVGNTGRHIHIIAISKSLNKDNFGILDRIGLYLDHKTAKRLSDKLLKEVKEVKQHEQKR